MKVIGLKREFIVVGENVHCTRILLRKGKRIGKGPDDRVSVLWADKDGTQRFMPIPDKIKKSNDYAEGRVKHVQAAVSMAMAEEGHDAQEGMDYLCHVVERQVSAGADFLDLNTDEISFKHAEQQEAMRWLVRTVQRMTQTPLSVDSSLLETIKAGMEVYDSCHGWPLLNSASLERREALDLAVEHHAHVIITGAGAAGMPQNTEERVENASRTIDLAVEKGIQLGDIQVDLLVFPISVDSQFGLHFLNAVREIRQRYGPEIHLTGGMSNVSFGIPCRSLVNDTFVNLAIEMGADGGIIDPVTRSIEKIVAMDRESHRYQLARGMLLGEDIHCKNFLKAFRKGELQPA